MDHLVLIRIWRLHWADTFNLFTEKENRPEPQDSPFHREREEEQPEGSGRHQVHPRKLSAEGADYLLVTITSLSLQTITFQAVKLKRTSHHIPLCLNWWGIAIVQCPLTLRECVKFAADPSKKWRPLAAKSGPNKCHVCLCGAPEDEHRKRWDYFHLVPSMPFMHKVVFVYIVLFSLRRKWKHKER